MSNMTSRGSPSAPSVPGMKPKSNGNDSPTGKTALRVKSCSLGSKSNLFRLPFGVSITTRRERRPTRGFRRPTGDSFDFLPIPEWDCGSRASLAARDLQPNCLHVVFNSDINHA
jgi:hypothetical protein